MNTQCSFDPDSPEDSRAEVIWCPVCTLHRATLLPDTRVFVPCESCLADGWELVRWRTAWGRWRARYRSYRPGDYRRPRHRARVR